MNTTSNSLFNFGSRDPSPNPSLKAPSPKGYASKTKTQKRTGSDMLMSPKQ